MITRKIRNRFFMIALVLGIGIAISAAGTTSNALKYGMPSTEQGQDKLVNHAVYSLMYDNEKNNPDWVSQYLTKEAVESEEFDRDDFKFDDDPAIEGEAQKSDYTKTGYDKGHMAPAEDMESSDIEMKECFYMTNMCPQKHSLNGGKWKIMEEIARNVALDKGKAWIISGPVYYNAGSNICSGTIGKENKIVIPQAFYKVIYYKDKGKDKVIAFLIPHMKGKAKDYFSLDSYLTTVDEIEAKTGFNFLDKLADTIENKIEGEKVTAQEYIEFLN